MAEVRSVEGKMEEGANYCHFLSACCDCLFLPFAFLASQPSPMHSPAQHPPPIIALTNATCLLPALPAPDSATSIGPRGDVA